jgi:hypothetical protein
VATGPGASPGGWQRHTRGGGGVPGGGAVAMHKRRSAVARAGVVGGVEDWSGINWPKRGPVGARACSALRVGSWGPPVRGERRPGASRREGPRVAATALAALSGGWQSGGGAVGGALALCGCTVRGRAGGCVYVVDVVAGGRWYTLLALVCPPGLSDSSVQAASAAAAQPGASCRLAGGQRHPNRWLSP